MTNSYPSRPQHDCCFDSVHGNIYSGGDEGDKKGESTQEHHTGYFHHSQTEIRVASLICRSFRNDIDGRNTSIIHSRYFFKNMVLGASRGATVKCLCYCTPPQLHNTLKQAQAHCDHRRRTRSRPMVIMHLLLVSLVSILLNKPAQAQSNSLTSTIVNISHSDVNEKNSASVTFDSFTLTAFDTPEVLSQEAISGILLSTSNLLQDALQNKYLHNIFDLSLTVTNVERVIRPEIEITFYSETNLENETSFDDEKSADDDFAAVDWNPKYDPNITSATNSLLKSPSASPVVAVTSNPTLIPTLSVTDSPTPSPTSSPTTLPTALVTKLPTASPVVTMTSSPTLFPTLSATDSPNANPSTSPTVIPTISPAALSTKHLTNKEAGMSGNEADLTPRLFVTRAKAFSNDNLNAKVFSNDNLHDDDIGNGHGRQLQSKMRNTNENNEGTKLTLSGNAIFSSSGGGGPPSKDELTRYLAEAINESSNSNGKGRDGNLLLQSISGLDIAGLDKLHSIMASPFLDASVDAGLSLPTWDSASPSDSPNGEDNLSSPLRPLNPDTTNEVGQFATTPANSEPSISSKSNLDVILYVSLAFAAVSLVALFALKRKRDANSLQSRNSTKKEVSKHLNISFDDNYSETNTNITKCNSSFATPTSTGSAMMETPEERNNRYSSMQTIRICPSWDSMGNIEDGFGGTASIDPELEVPVPIQNMERVRRRETPPLPTKPKPMLRDIGGSDKAVLSVSDSQSTLKSNEELIYNDEDENDRASDVMSTSTPRMDNSTPQKKKPLDTKNHMTPSSYIHPHHDEDNRNTSNASFFDELLPLPYQWYPNSDFKEGYGIQIAQFSPISVEKNKHTNKKMTKIHTEEFEADWEDDLPYDWNLPLVHDSEAQVVRTNARKQAQVERSLAGNDWVSPRMSPRVTQLKEPLTTTTSDTVASMNYILASNSNTNTDQSTHLSSPTHSSIDASTTSHTSKSRSTTKSGTTLSKSDSGGIREEEEGARRPNSPHQLDADGSFPRFTMDSGNNNDDYSSRNNAGFHDVKTFTDHNKQTSMARSISSSSGIYSNSLHPMDWSNADASTATSHLTGDTTIFSYNSEMSDLEGKAIWDQYLADQRRQKLREQFLKHAQENPILLNRPPDRAYIGAGESFSTGLSSTTYELDSHGDDVTFTDDKVAPGNQIIHDILWLEKKLAERQTSSDIDISVEGDLGITTTNAAASNANYAAPPPPPPPLPMRSIACRDCYAPPGKLQIVIHSTMDGPSIHSVASGSSLEGQLFSKDLIIAVDNVDTRNMSAEQVMKIMQAKRALTRKITVLHFED